MEGCNSRIFDCSADFENSNSRQQNRGNAEDERLFKIQKIGELLKLDKMKTKMFYVMDEIRNEKEEKTKKLFINFIEKMVLEKGDKEQS
mgnify:CR=1 FL=1